MSPHVSNAGAERDLSRKVQELEFELTEARRQQAATADVLKVISRSKFDLQPVLETLVENATRLVAADAGLLARADGELFRIVAGYGASPDVHEYWRRNVIRPGRGAPIGRAALERRTVHIVDLLADPEYDLQEAQRIHGGRSVLAVPMLRREELIGVFFIYRTIVQAFTEKQIDLVTTFAEQAVIAIENTRLFEEVQTRTRELTESLEYQTATSEVLSVISRSPTAVQPVFDAIAQSAARLCRAQFCHVFRFDGTLIHFAAVHGLTPEGRDALRSLYPMPPGRATAVARSILTCAVEEIPDVRADTEYSVAHSLVIGFRSVAAVPMLKDGRPIGAVAVLRSQTGHFPERQIQLLKTFADQAVIAIENTRLFEEVQARTVALRESLEYQTATSDVLSVISRSPSDLQPVLDTIVETAARLCQSDNVHVFTLKDGRYHLAAFTKSGTELIQYLRDNPITPGQRGSVTGRAAREGRTVHLPDTWADPDYGSGPITVGNNRTVLSVPLLREGVPLGVITLARRMVKPFSERQIELITMFADQAVIALENTRLFEEVQSRTKELQEALEYQTATSNVLNVISRAPSQLQPVFEAIVSTARMLCQADNAFVYTLDGDAYRLATSDRAEEEYVKFLRDNPIAPGRGTLVGRVSLEKRTVHLPDATSDPDYDWVESPKRGNFRTMLGVPLMRDGMVIGVIAMVRRAVSPFSLKQVDLVTTFADQALIAIQNVRLFDEVQTRTRELTESLEYQTAMSDVLGVISSSPNRLQPVLDAIVNTAKQLCIADRAFFSVLQKGRYHLVASTGDIPEDIIADVRAKPVVAGRGSHVGRALLERRPVHIADIRLDPEFTFYDVNQPGRARTLLAVPLLRDDEVIGVITLARINPGAFTRRQIDLVTTFANQAVIAINNVDLFEEVQARNRELRVTLEQQTSTSEVLSVISRSKFDLQPVFDTIARGAAQLCGGVMGCVFRYDGSVMNVGAMVNFAEGGEETWRHPYPRPATHDTATGRAILEKTVAMVTDVETDSRADWAREVARTGGYRSALAVPMLREDEAIGAILVARAEPGPFPEDEIDLLKTFADQAVIAIQNTRLFEEVQARNRDLTALGEVARAVSSTLDLKLVLKTIVERAVELSGTDAGSIFYYRQEAGRFELGETAGLDQEVVARFRRLDIATGQTGLGEAIANRQPLQVPDVVLRPSNTLRDAALEAGLRAALIVPLLVSEGALGALVLQRRRTGEFAPSVVSLMQSFAGQSAIALENARLFEEIARKSRDLEIASQHKSQFVANMSHELRTPLAAILGYAELMQEGFYEAQGPKSLDALIRIRSNGKHLLGLINTVLDIAKIESGQFTLNMAEYAIESVVETVRSATESLAQNKKLALKTEVAKSLPIGLGDEQRLTQVLLNLVGNAIKFTDAGEVRVMAKAINGHFSVTVADTGPGIPPAEQARIFEQFHQVDGSLTKAKGGTGLGLAIARQIVEMHGGRIWVESTVGEGSTFQMEIPTRAQFTKSAP